MRDLTIRPEFYTHDRVSTILSRFGLADGRNLDILPMPQGFGMALVRARHPRFDVVIKQHDTARHADRTRFALRYHRHLHEAGLPCPRLHATPAGDLLTVVDGRGYSVQDWCPGDRFDVETADSASRRQYRRQVGTLLGMLHAAGTPDLADQAPESCKRPAHKQFRQLPEVATALPWGRVGRLGNTLWLLKNEPNNFGGTLRRALPLLTEARRRLIASPLADDPRLAELHPVHGDVHFDNLLFVDGRIAGLVDFDNASLTPMAIDLGSAAAVVCAEREHEDEFLAAYAEAARGGVATAHALDPEVLRASVLLRVVRSLLYQIPLYTSRTVRLPEKSRWWIERLIRMLEIECDNRYS